TRLKITTLKLWLGLKLFRKQFSRRIRDFKTRDHKLRPWRKESRCNSVVRKSSRMRKTVRNNNMLGWRKKLAKQTQHSMKQVSATMLPRQHLTWLMKTQPACRPRPKHNRQPNKKPALLEQLKRRRG